jgi:hypothetical protein
LYDNFHAFLKGLDTNLKNTRYKIMRDCGMKGKKIEEMEGSAIGRYIRSTSDIASKGTDIRNSYILPSRNDMRSIADITELGEFITKIHCDKKECYII